jgi:hypothetical protein
MSKTAKSKRKTAARRHQRQRHGTQRPKPAARPMSDRAVYLAALIIGLFIVVLGWAFTEGLYWREFVFGYVALLLLTINMAGWDVYRARHIAHWRQSLAKLVLGPAGYGTKTGKALEASHGQPEAGNSLLIAAAASIVVLAGLAAVLIWLI